MTTWLETESLGSDPRSLRRIGGWFVAASSASIVLVSLFYLATPPAAIEQTLGADPAAAAAATLGGAATMRLAGTFGVFGDLGLAVGALLLMTDAARKGFSAAAAGWGAVAVSALVFEVVDVVFGFALPAAAAGPGLSAFQALRDVYAALFLAGAAAFGLGAVLVLLGDRSFGRVLRTIGVVDGAVAVAASLLTFAGLPLGLMVGACVGIGAMLFVAVGVVAARGEG